MKKNTDDARDRFLKTTNTDPDLIKQTDRIQKISKYFKNETSLCQFSRPMQVRRLLSIGAHAWTNNDVRASVTICGEIEALKKDKTQKATLALACLGYFRRGLVKMLDSLDRRAELLRLEPETSETETTDLPGEEIDGDQETEPTEPLGSLSDMSEALDEATLQDLEDLKKDVAALADK
jgi:hypothetical protein